LWNENRGLVKLHSECFHCFLNQTREAVKVSTHDKEIMERAVNTVQDFLWHVSPQANPPEVAQTVYRLVREITGDKDPYFSLKEKYNRLALGLYPGIKERLQGENNPLKTAVKLAAAGNIIDFGIGIGEFTLEEVIDKALLTEFVVNDYAEFASSVSTASKILYVGDNAGEIVFDRILIEEMKRIRDFDVTFAVRGGPIINDVNIKDALEVGMDAVAEIISSGLDVPGTILSRSSKELIRAYASADTVIVKGQGNYETLNEENKNIFFILRAKCQVVARELKVNLGDQLLISQKKQWSRG